MMKTLSVINKIQIVQLDGDLIPIKPICQALGIDEDAQRRKIYGDEFFNSVAVLSTATGADKKEYEMLCLPLPYIFSWLATINPKNVKEEAKEASAEPVAVSSRLFQIRQFFRIDWLVFRLRAAPESVALFPEKVQLISAIDAAVCHIPPPVDAELPLNIPLVMVVLCS